MVLLLTACGSTLTTLPYTENFSDAGSGWKTVTGQAVQIFYKDNGLNFKINELDSIAWSTPQGKRFSDFVLDVDATQVAGPSDNSYGIIFRQIDDRNFYRIDISGDGYYDVLKYKGGKWIKLQDWSEASAIKKDQNTNHLQVVAKGNQYGFRVNDQPVTTFEDNDFKDGNVGLTAGTLFDNAGVQVAFKNLRVSEVKP